ncbi:MAG: bifunctional diaminohydroxyphosphoribosylaminopyrimidine deaminase/5-amino-6-(5-phosphoribosylamino)uracil reductase RibD [Capsulimonadaceae bacterium]|nr:bifunctional diaminohydroxyphosphoribosylaminopyrimidine deaminase/5-amino-6-(5-phosphoribosylamino)uracil reductase RibD [Capsulimonadaceae bacterium]
MTSDDKQMMARALRRASLGRHASPNPMVGCVILSPVGVVAGVGFHPQPGAPHAEVYALREAGDLARGGTAYVTLEPCSHYGRTPPCADALIRAGLKRVVVAMEDPDARVSGRGIARLRDAGILVDVGICIDAAMHLNRMYVKHRATGLPWVTVKVATTLDGKIATADGDSKWITSPLTRLWVHRQLRDRVDAIMVGVGTVLADDPSLTTRLGRSDSRNPRRIVVDSRLRTPPSSAVLNGPARDPAVIACVQGASQERATALRSAGGEILECAGDPDGRVDLLDLLRRLGDRGDIIHILLEGGGKLIGSALRSGIVDRYIATIAPKIIGGDSAPGPVGGDAVASRMAEAHVMIHQKVRRSGPDVVIDGDIYKAAARVSTK